MKDPASRWTHAICEKCWRERNPGRTPTRVLDAEREVCCYCSPFVAARTQPLLLKKHRREMGVPDYDRERILRALMEERDPPLLAQPIRKRSSWWRSPRPAEVNGNQVLAIAAARQNEQVQKAVAARWKKPPR